MRDISRLPRRALLQGLAATGVLTPVASVTAAGTWPTQQVTLVAPFTPGGPVDVLARVIAQGVQAESRQPVVVENRTGANGNIGIDLVRRAMPDGYTLLVVPAGNLTINPTLMQNLSFDVERDFAPVSLLATAPNVIVTAPDSPFKDFAGLIAYAKAQPQGITYASPGVGSQLHLAAELLAQRADIQMLHVPYRGSSQTVADAMTGQVQLLFSNLPAVLPSLREGKLRAIALTTAGRTPLAPEIPTLNELGMQGFDITSWYGMLAPRATPVPVVDGIIQEIRRVLASPATRRSLEMQGLNVLDESGDAFAQRIRRETAMWAEVIRSRNIQSGL